MNLQPRPDFRAIMNKGSVSFSLAATLFGAKTRDSARVLYAWCRACDDRIDGDSPSRPPADQALALREIHGMTVAALEGKPCDDPVFAAFGQLTREFGIPSYYPLELLEGMAMDARGERYETFRQLEHYCFRVAGTVGLMMTHIMGLSDEKALTNANSLGMAMQLTNIARDVIEDSERGRVYLPAAWIREEGIPAEQLNHPAYRPKLARLALRLIQTAEPHYESGRAGLRFLPFRCALAVAAALRIYREIGLLVVERREAAWDTRTVVPRGRKLRALLLGIVDVLVTVPARLKNPRSRVSIRHIWRFS